MAEITSRKASRASTKFASKKDENSRKPGTIINNNHFTIQYVSEKPKKKSSRQKSKMIFSSGILSKDKNFRGSDNSSEDSDSNDTKDAHMGLLAPNIMDQVGQITGQLQERLQTSLGSSETPVQTNITINNFNINQVINPAPANRPVGDQDQRKNLKKRGESSVKIKGEGRQSKGLKKVKSKGSEQSREAREKKVQPERIMEEEPATEKKEQVKGKKNLLKSKKEPTENRQSKAGESGSQLKPMPKTKKRPISLNTAFKVLKKHLEKVKSNLIIHFRESIEKEFHNFPERPSSSAHQVSCKPNRPHELVLLFNCLRGSHEAEDQKPEPATEEQKKLGKSARMDSHRHIIDQMDQQTKLERLEITFLSFVEKLFGQMSNSAELGLFVYFSDYLRILRRNVFKILNKFDQLKRSQVVQILAADLRKTRAKYIEQKLIEWDKLSEHLKDYKIKATFYPRSHLQNRVYEEVDSYQVSCAVTGSLSGCRDLDQVREKYQIQQLLRSDKRPECARKECVCVTESLEQFCTFKPHQSSWTSTCVNKEKRIECDTQCGPDCNNSFLRKEEYQRLGQEVSLRQCWGIDFYSRKNLFHLLPKELSHRQRALIIDNIVRELNFQGHNGWNIIKSARKTQRDIQMRLASLRGSNEIVDTGERMVGGDLQDFFYSENMEAKELLQEVEMLARGIEVLIKQLGIKQLRDCVRSFSKGLGVVCVNPRGILRNSLIVRYFGEVYPPWFWYLKQDAIKSFLSKLKKGHCRKLAQYRTNYNMEFYNIFLEKHRDEPQGTELLVIDPIIKGNYASRLSHSCDPNCVTLPVVSEGQYSIGRLTRHVLAETHPLRRRIDLRLLFIYRVRKGVSELGVPVWRRAVSGLLPVMQPEALSRIPGGQKSAAGQF